MKAIGSEPEGGGGVERPRLLCVDRTQTGGASKANGLFFLCGCGGFLFSIFYLCELRGRWCGCGNSPKRRAFIRGRAASLRVCGGRNAWVVGERDMWGMFRVGPEMSVR